MQQVLKDILSVKGLIMLIALVALGLSITAVVRGCGDNFGAVGDLCECPPQIGSVECGDRSKFHCDCSVTTHGVGKCVQGSAKNDDKPQFITGTPDCEPCTIGQQCNCGSNVGTCKDIGSDSGYGGCFLNKKHHYSTGDLPSKDIEKNQTIGKDFGEGGHGEGPPDTLPKTSAVVTKKASTPPPPSSGGFPEWATITLSSVGGVLLLGLVIYLLMRMKHGNKLM